MGDSLFAIAVQYGLPTVLLFVMGFAYYKKDQAFSDEQKARIEDAKIFYDRLSKGQDVITAIVAKLGDETEIRSLTRELLDAAKVLGGLTADLKQKERERELRDTRAGGPDR